MPITSPDSFGRANRIVRSSDYARVLKINWRFAGRWFVLNAASSPESRARLGLAIAKRRVVKAVVRNRIKRVVRESFRRRCADLPALDIVVRMRRTVGDVGNAALFADLDNLWRRVEKYGTAGYRNDR